MTDFSGWIHEQLKYWEEITPEEAQACIDNGEDVSKWDGRKVTPLHMTAMYNKNHEVTQVLLKNGARVNSQDDMLRDTPLHYAARSTENPKVIKALLDGGANGTIPNNEGKTAFELGERNQYLEGTDELEALGKASGQID